MKRSNSNAFRTLTQYWPLLVAETGFMLTRNTDFFFFHSKRSESASYLYLFLLLQKIRDHFHGT